MLSRFLIVSYDVLVEVALWLFFIAFAIAGLQAGGAMGLLGGLLAAFLISVFLVAPFMMISDLRKTVARIEKQKSA